MSFDSESKNMKNETNMGSQKCTEHDCSHNQPVNIRGLSEFVKEFATTPDKNLTSLHQAKTSMSFDSESKKTSNKTDMGQSCTDCDHKHCGHVQPVNIRGLSEFVKEFSTTPDKNLTSLHQAKTSMSFVSESKKTSNKTNKNCKLCPKCGTEQNSNVVKNCKNCKHKFVIKCKKASSLQGKSTKKCIRCKKEARSNRASHCIDENCGMKFPSGHKTKKKRPTKSKKTKKKIGHKRKKTTPLNVRKLSIEPVWDPSTISMSPSALSRQASLDFTGYEQEKSIEPVWDPSTLSMSPSALSRQASLDFSPVCDPSTLSMSPSTLSRQSSLDFSGYDQIPTDNVTVLTTKEDEGLMQDNINVWMQDIYNQI